MKSKIYRCLAPLLLSAASFAQSTPILHHHARIERPVRPDPTVLARVNVSEYTCYDPRYDPHGNDLSTVEPEHQCFLLRNSSWFGQPDPDDINVWASPKKFYPVTHIEFLGKALGHLTFRSDQEGSNHLETDPNWGCKLFSPLDDTKYKEVTIHCTLRTAQ